ncbi:MAG: hypothetical protein E6I93_19885 [Chloroflexi bacterium]|nr:MAG: hypothetical protein E6I93_19885 [Chloroflexota bacterium]
MNSKEITDLIIAFQAVITLFISLRAFYLYSKTRSDTLFIVGLSMAVIGLGGITGLIGDYLITRSSFNTFWFRYIGQTVSYLFIFFISLPGAERHVRSLKRLNLVNRRTQWRSWRCLSGHIPQLLFRDLWRERHTLQFFDVRRVSFNSRRHRGVHFKVFCPKPVTL